MSMIKAVIAVLSGGMGAEAKVAAALEILLAASPTQRQKSKPVEKIAEYAVGQIRRLGPLTANQIHVSKRGMKTCDILTALGELVASGEVVKVVEAHPVNGTNVVRYAINDHGGAK